MAVEDATGREVQIDRLDFALFPSISVDLAGVRLANAEGMPSPEMISLGSLELELGLFPLLGKSVEIDRLVVSELAVFLEKDASGRLTGILRGLHIQHPATDPPDPFPVELFSPRSST